MSRFARRRLNVTTSVGAPRRARDSRLAPSTTVGTRPARERTPALSEGTLTSASTTSMASTVHTLMPRLRSDLARLVAIPSDLRARATPRRRTAAARGLRRGRRAVPRRGRPAASSSLDLPDTAPVVAGEIPAPAGRADGAAVRPLRRRAGRRRVEVGVAAVRGDRARRRDLRARLGRLEVEHPHARRRAARLGAASRPSGSSS